VAGALRASRRSLAASPPRRLAAEHGLRLYSTDDAMSDHAGRSKTEDSPFLAEFTAMDMDERWVNRY